LYAYIWGFYDRSWWEDYIVGVIISICHLNQSKLFLVEHRG